MEEYFGIDFGTTNSAVIGRLLQHVTYYHDGYDQPFPSLVAIDKTTGEIHSLGRDAWDHRAELSEYCQIITSSKMDLEFWPRSSVRTASMQFCPRHPYREYITLYFKGNAAPRPVTTKTDDETTTRGK